MAELYNIGKDDIRISDIFVAVSDTWVTNLKQYYVVRALAPTKGGNWRMEFLATTRNDTIISPIHSETHVRLAQPIRQHPSRSPTVARWSTAHTCWALSIKLESGFVDKLLLQQRYVPGLTLEEEWYSR